jgi:hypothetical protein
MEFIQNPSHQKTAEHLSPESRANAPGCPFESEDSKRVEFFAEWMVAMFNKLSSNHAGQYTLSFHHPIHRSLSRANCPFRKGPRFQGPLPRSPHP